MTNPASATEFQDRLSWMAHHTGQFLRLLFGKFFQHGSTEAAGSLTYTTLLSLVPFMTVVLAIFSAFPVADRVADAVQEFVFQNFVPAAGEVVKEYLNEFSAKASRMTGVGFAFLIVVALMMMSNIDRALNAIWEVRGQRNLLSKFLVYWAVLSLGPILIALSVALTSYLVSLPMLSGAAASGLGRKLLGLMPVAASAIAFALIYALVPNRRVKLRHALVGGVLAAALFEIAKRAFGYYVTNFPSYEAIYGALATVPIFLVWVYLSWIVILFGAEFTHCLGIYRDQRVRTATGGSRLPQAIAILNRLAEKQHEGEALSAMDLTEVTVNASVADVENLLQDLRASHHVHQTEEGRWVAARNPENVRLYELVRSHTFALPRPDQVWDQDQRRFFEAFEQELKSKWDRPVSALGD